MDIHLLFEQTFNSCSSFRSRYLVVAIPGIFGGSIVQIRLVLGFPSAGLTFSFLGSARSVTTCPMLSSFQIFVVVVCSPIFFVLVASWFKKIHLPLFCGVLRGGQGTYMWSVLCTDHIDHIGWDFLFLCMVLSFLLILTSLSFVYYPDLYSSWSKNSHCLPFVSSYLVSRECPILGKPIWDPLL